MIGMAAARCLAARLRSSGRVELRKVTIGDLPETRRRSSRRNEAPEASQIACLEHREGIAPSPGLLKTRIASDAAADAARRARRLAGGAYGHRHATRCCRPPGEEPLLRATLAPQRRPAPRLCFSLVASSVRRRFRSPLVALDSLYLSTLEPPCSIALAPTWRRVVDAGDASDLVLALVCCASEVQDNLTVIVDE